MTNATSAGVNRTTAHSFLWLNHRLVNISNLWLNVERSASDNQHDARIRRDSGDFFLREPTINCVVCHWETFDGNRVSHVFRIDTAVSEDIFMGPV